MGRAVLEALHTQLVATGKGAMVQLPVLERTEVRQLQGRPAVSLPRPEAVVPVGAVPCACSTGAAQGSKAEGGPAPPPGEAPGCWSLPRPDLQGLHPPDRQRKLWSACLKHGWVGRTQAPMPLLPGWS